MRSFSSGKPALLIFFASITLSTLAALFFLLNVSAQKAKMELIAQDKSQLVLLEPSMLEEVPTGYNRGIWQVRAECLPGVDITNNRILANYVRWNATCEPELRVQSLELARNGRVRLVDGSRWDKHTADLSLTELTTWGRAAYQHYQQLYPCFRFYLAGSYSVRGRYLSLYVEGVAQQLLAIENHEIAVVELNSAFWQERTVQRRLARHRLRLMHKVLRQATGMNRFTPWWRMLLRLLPPLAHAADGFQWPEPGQALLFEDGFTWLETNRAFARGHWYRLPPPDIKRESSDNRRWRRMAARWQAEYGVEVELGENGVYIGMRACQQLAQVAPILTRRRLTREEILWRRAEQQIWYLRQAAAFWGLEYWRPFSALLAQISTHTQYLPSGPGALAAQEHFQQYC